MDRDFALKIIEKTRDDYNLIAPHFDVTRKYPWEEFSEFKKYIRGEEEILDLGCGNGRLVSFLNKITKVRPLLQGSDPCNRYVGLDISEEIIKTARKNHPNFKFLVGDFLNLPFPDDTFDIIFSIASFHHIPSTELRLEALKEMKRVLKKDGIILMIVWNLGEQEKYQPYIKNARDERLEFNDYSSSRAKRNREVTAKKFSTSSNDIQRNGQLDLGDSLIPWKDEKGKVLAERYYHAFTKEELKTIFENSGFKIKEIVANKFNIVIIAK